VSHFMFQESDRKTAREAAMENRRSGVKNEGA